MSSELPAPAGCLSWADIAVQSHSEKGVLLVRERLEQEKMHNPEQGWMGVDLFGADGAVCPQTASSSCGLGCALCPSSLGPQIHKMSMSESLQCVIVRENAAREAVTHSLSRGSSLSSGSFLPLCTLGRKERYQLVRHGRRPLVR